MDPRPRSTATSSSATRPAQLVAAAVTWNAATRTATLDPTAKLAGRRPTPPPIAAAPPARVTRRRRQPARDHVTWTFTTAGRAGGDPARAAVRRAPRRHRQRGGRPSGGRGRRQVPVRRRGFDHGAPLLQGHREHRHARRQPVDAPRARSSATATFSRRDRVRLAAGRPSRRRSRSRPTRPTSPRTSRRSATTPPTAGYFTAAAVDNPPLHALGERRRRRATASTATAPAAFPTRPSTRANYWVDVVFTTSAGGPTRRRRP